MATANSQKKSVSAIKPPMLNNNNVSIKSKSIYQPLISLLLVPVAGGQA